jgi:hypothetical protein
MPLISAVCTPALRSMPGLVIVIPNVVPTLQKELVEAVLDHVWKRDLINTVIEVGIEDGQIAIVEYKLPDEK